MTFFIRNGNTFTAADSRAAEQYDKLPPGNYTVGVDMFGNFFMNRVDSFEMPPRIYGNTVRQADRILNTFHDRPASTGVMLAGDKGSGKTLLGKMLANRCAELGYPCLLINTPFCGDGFNKFIQLIEQPCMILFDEFEKVYGEKEQEAILTLLDGVFPSKKLFVLTCNAKWRVDDHMKNRPGRIFYMLEFDGLGPEFIRDYCNVNLKATEYIDQIVKLSMLYQSFNFDVLKALVEEMNRYNESPADAMRLLNGKPDYSDNKSFEIQNLVVGGEKVPINLACNDWRGNPLTQPVRAAFYVGNLIHKLKEAKADGWDITGYDPDEIDEHTWLEVYFHQKHLRRLDENTGNFVFQNGDFILHLKEQKPKAIDYFAL